MRTIGKTFHRRINVLLGEMRGNATEILNFEKRPHHQNLRLRLK